MKPQTTSESRFLYRMGWVSLVLAFIALGLAAIMPSIGMDNLIAFIIAGVFLFGAAFNWWGARKFSEPHE